LSASPSICDILQSMSPNRPLKFRNRTAPLIGIVLCALCVRAALMASTHRTVEDFYITLRYAVNLADHNEFAYNLGEHVLGTTTPLYTLFLAAVAKMGMAPIFWGKILNIFADGASCVFIYRLGRAAGRPGVGLPAAAVFAVWPTNLYWAISGMETALVTAAGLAVFVCLAERRPLGMACFGAVLVLLRIDGLLLVLVAFAALWMMSRKPEREGRRISSKDFVRAALLFIVLLLPWVIFATLYFGSPIPTSLVAKLAVYAWQAKSVFPNLKPFTSQMTHNLNLLLLIGVVPGIVVVSKRIRALWAPVIWMLLYYAAMAFSKSFLFGWYYVPPAPVYILVSVLGWAWAVNALSARLPQKIVAWRFAALQVCLAGILFVGIVMTPRLAVMIRNDQREDVDLLETTGRALKDTVKPGERVMLEPIGYIGYYSGVKVLDAVGLVSPEIIPYFRKGAVSPYLDIMAGLKPEYVLLRTGEYHDALDAKVPPYQALLANYTLVREFRPEGAAPNSEAAFFLFKRKR
jgi:hypothetical protein